jgi:tRNA (adenine22-N1)-methyltransferase
MVPQTDTVADIGCDHGKVAVALVKEGRAKNAVCSDISGRSLDKARKRVSAKKMEDRISLREGDGLSVLGVGEADVIVLAGMGGELIADILQADADKTPDTLVLSCNTASGKLRQWLCANGYYIADEAIEYENRRYYPIMLAKKGQSAKLSDIEMEFGPVLLKKKPKPLKHFVRLRIEKTKVIRSKIAKSNSERRDMLLKELDARLEEYRNLEKCL